MEYRELDGIDGEPVELECSLFPGHTTLQLLREIQTTIAEKLEQFKDRIIFMSMYSDIDWTKDGNDQLCISNSLEFGPGTEEKCMERTPTSPKVCGTAVQI